MSRAAVGGGRQAAGVSGVTVVRQTGRGDPERNGLDRSASFSAQVSLLRGISGSWHLAENLVLSRWQGL